MNKWELIEDVEKIGIYNLNLFGNKVKSIPTKTAIKLIKQLDEPEKVKVPKFVADWIEYCKFTHVDLQHALNVGDVYFYNYANQKDFSKLQEFLETENNQATFARAWLDGYEVEKEKRYLVKMKDITISTRYLKYNTQSANWFLSGHEEAFPYRTKHTREQLEKAGFEWVFDCQGIEIKEVTE